MNEEEVEKLVAVLTAEYHDDELVRTTDPEWYAMRLDNQRHVARRMLKRMEKAGLTVSVDTSSDLIEARSLLSTFVDATNATLDAGRDLRLLRHCAHEAEVFLRGTDGTGGTPTRKDGEQESASCEPARDLSHTASRAPSDLIRFMQRIALALDPASGDDPLPTEDMLVERVAALSGFELGEFGDLEAREANE